MKLIKSTAKELDIIVLFLLFILRTPAWIIAAYLTVLTVKLSKETFGLIRNYRKARS